MAESSDAPKVPQLNCRWAQLGPLAKLSVWAILLTVLVAAIEMSARLVHLPFSIFDKNFGSPLLVITALVSLLAVISTERRPLAEYGLTTPPDWFKRAVIGAGIGAVVYLAYCCFATFVGAFQFRTADVTPARLAKAALAAISSIPVAATQQIIFAGLLVGMLRQATTVTTAVLVPAAVFAAFAGTAKDGGLVQPEGQRLFVGMALVAAVLGLLRLRTGSIVFSTGVLAGAIAVRKVIGKLHLLELNPSSQWMPWLAPNADPRQAPVMWLVLAMATGGVAAAVWRWGECRLDDDTRVAASFKRAVPFSNLLAFAPLDRWLVLLAAARFKVGLVYLPRLLFTLITSALTTLLTFPERVLAPRLLKHPVPPPVFIVGMQRSGTTHLHNLLALDPQFRSPRNYQVFNPHGFISGWLTTAAMTPLLMWRRPMDAVQMTVFSSQEEEFALAAMGSESPYWMFCFPREIDRYDRFWQTSAFSVQELQRWQRHYVTFLRKLTWWKRRRPLLKNPANTGRVAQLRAMFPEAKFVYIVRQPHAVYRSNVHLARHGFVVFQLQDPDVKNNYESRILSHYRRVTDACEHDLRELPPQSSARVRFEDLEADPIRQIERLYSELGIEMSQAFRQRLTEYVNLTAGYRKNHFAQLTPEETAAVDAAMGPYVESWGYSDPSQRHAA